jgi:hypothetical protein
LLLRGWRHAQVHGLLGRRTQSRASWAVAAVLLLLDRRPNYGHFPGPPVRPESARLERGPIDAKLARELKRKKVIEVNEWIGKWETQSMLIYKKKQKISVFSKINSDFYITFIIKLTFNLFNLDILTFSLFCF